MSIENYSVSEKSGFSEIKLPQSHLEGVDPSKMEGFSESEKTRLIGENFYSEKLENAAGLKNAFKEISEEGSKEEFVNLYERYVDDAEDLKKQDPEAYGFLKERVFHGKEYILNGLEKFMRDTAPKKVEKVVEEKPLVELYNKDTVLSKNEIHRNDISNCERPFSYGDINKMSEKVEAVESDKVLMPFAADRMVAMRNLMALCGHCGPEVDGIDVALFVKEKYMYDGYDPVEVAMYTDYGHTNREMPYIIEKMSGVECEALEGSPVETVATMLDHGYRGMVTYNAEILDKDDTEKESIIEKVRDIFPRSANATSTMLAAVRDGNSGKLAGFMICDTNKEETARYVEVEQLKKAVNVENGNFLLTKKPYFDE